MNEENFDELEELDSVDEAPEQAPAGATEGHKMPSSQELQAHSVGLLNKLVERSYSGLGAPLFNPNASKDYYRFFFAGLLIVIGCLMPFDQDFTHTGYKTFVGGFMLLIGLGLCWAAWGAVNTGVFRMKWALLCIVPLIYGVLHAIDPVPTPPDALHYLNEQMQAKTGTAWDTAIENYKSALAANTTVDTWGEFFNLFSQNVADKFSRVGLALQRSGVGKWFVLFGALLAELTFLMGIFGGAKQIKEQKKARASARRR